MSEYLLAAGFAAYLLGVLVLGFRAWRRTRDRADYLLGGRSLGRVVAALSAGASDMSGWLLLGLPGFAYASGVQALWLVAGLLIGAWLNWRFVAARLREQTARMGNALTLPAWFAARFPDRARALRLAASVLIVCFFLFYTASGLVAGGKLFGTVFGWDYRLAVVIGAAIIVLYTVFGGFLAVSWTDVFQGLLMLAALVLTALLATALPDANGTVRPADRLLDPFASPDGGAIGLLGIVSLAGWGLGYFGQPHVLARFMALRDAGLATGARRIGIGWAATAMLAAVWVGLAGTVLAPGLDGTSRETVFIVLVEQLFHPAVAGLLLAAVLAAIMSTADSQLLVCASALADDLPGLAGVQLDERRALMASRAAVVGIALIATALAWSPDNAVLDLVAYAWGGLGAVFGPAILFALYSRRVTGTAILAGMLIGAIAIVAWHNLSGGLFELYELVPAFVLASVVIAVFSRRAPAR